MSENNNELDPEKIPDADDRASRISAIKKALHSGAEPPAEEWENELAERIARKVKKVKENKASSAQDILDQLDDAIASVNEHTAEPEEPKPEMPYHIPEPGHADEYVEPTVNAPLPELVRKKPVSHAAPENQPVSHAATGYQPVSHAAESVGPPENYAPPVSRAAEPQPGQRPVPKKKKSKKKKKKKKTFLQSLRGLFPEKGDSILERLRKLVFLGSVIAIIVCGYMVGDYYLDLWKNRMQNSDISDLYHTYPAIRSDEDGQVYEKEENKYYRLMDGAKKLLDINSEVVGYIQIPDTPVDNPVVQADDNKKYLNLNFRLNESRAGALFLDWRNHFDHVEGHYLYEPNSDNLVIYGHNMADESMFGSLKYYQWNYDYYDKHPLIYLNSNYETYTYKIFAFFVVDALDESETKYDCWNVLNFTGEEQFYEFINEAKKRTLRTNDVDMKYGDKLLTLSTCNTTLGDRGRLIIMARLLRPGEDPEEGTRNSEANPNIKWPSFYYESKPNEKYDPNAPFEPYGPSGTEEQNGEE